MINSKCPFRGANWALFRRPLKRTCHKPIKPLQTQETIKYYHSAKSENTFKMPQIKKILQKLFLCGHQRENDFGLETSNIITEDCELLEMLRDSSKTILDLRIETESYRNQIEILKLEIEKLQLENSGSLGSRSSSENSSESNKSEIESYHDFIRNLDFALDKVSQKAPKLAVYYRDLAIDV